MQFDVTQATLQIGDFDFPPSGSSKWYEIKPGSIGKVAEGISRDMGARVPNRRATLVISFYADEDAGKAYYALQKKMLTQAGTAVTYPGSAVSPDGVISEWINTTLLDGPAMGADDTQQVRTATFHLHGYSDDRDDA